MDELISKSALLEEIAGLVPYCGYCDGYGFVQLDCVEDAVKEAAVVDAVPVVRCKDCICCTVKKYDFNNEIYSCFCNAFVHSVKENDYCSWGERKENETD